MVNNMRPRSAPLKLIAIAAISVLIIFLSAAVSAKPLAQLTRWDGHLPGASFTQTLSGTFGPATPPPTGAGLPSSSTPAALQPNTELAGEAALERYNQGSALQESVGDGRVRYYRRDLPGGGLLAYFVVLLDEHVQLKVINADGATPATDQATGDTMWRDGQQHLQTVEAMAAAPHAMSDGIAPLAAMAFGFHGEIRTSDEGTVVIDNTLYHMNAGRATLCIASNNRARIGLFDAASITQCNQAIGGGPVILLGGKIANPEVSAPTDRFVPYNPLNEDFVQLDWRQTVYMGSAPKTAIGVGKRDNGTSYLVMMVAYGVKGLDLAEQFRALGCHDALGGDDDSSTQAVWRGTPVYDRAVGEVPDALAVYMKE
jgi:hypothetical protein